MPLKTTKPEEVVDSIEDPAVTSDDDTDNDKLSDDEVDNDTSDDTCWQMFCLYIRVCLKLFILATVFS